MHAGGLVQSPPAAPLLTLLLAYCICASPIAACLTLPALPCPADAEEIAERLLAEGYPAAYLSAQRTQLQRIEALNALRDFRQDSGAAQRVMWSAQRAARQHAASWHSAMHELPWPSAQRAAWRSSLPSSCF
jgi:hypothetical protein